MHATLNLLSPEKKAALRSGAAFAFIQTMAILLCTVSAFVFVSLVAVRMILVSTRDDLASRAAHGNEEVGAVSQEVRLINDYITRIEEFQARSGNGAALIAAVARLMPEKAVLEELRIEGDSVFLTGTAATRDDVLSLRQRLESSPLFVDVRSPFTNITKPTDVKFDFSMRLKNAPPKDEVSQ